MSGLMDLHLSNACAITEAGQVYTNGVYASNILIV